MSCKLSDKEKLEMVAEIKQNLTFCGALTDILLHTETENNANTGIEPICMKIWVKNYEEFIDSKSVKKMKEPKGDI